MQLDYEVPETAEAEMAEANLRAFLTKHVEELGDYELRQSFRLMRKHRFRAIAWSLFRQYRAQAGDGWSWEAFFTFLTALLPLIAQLLILLA